MRFGAHAVTVDEIAAAAGVGKQTIYRWWPTKSAVIMDALIELTDPVPTTIPSSTYEAVRLQMRRVARMFSSRNGELIRELVADAQGDPVLAQDFRDRFFAHRRAEARPLWPTGSPPATYGPTSTSTMHSTSSTPRCGCACSLGIAPWARPP